MKHASLAAVVLMGLAFAAGCGDASEPAGGPVAIHPSQLFTGFDDGSADYKVPASLVNVGSSSLVKWTLADPSFGEISTEQPAAGEKNSTALTHHVIVLTKKA